MRRSHFARARRWSCENGAESRFGRSSLSCWRPAWLCGFPCRPTKSTQRKTCTCTRSSVLANHLVWRAGIARHRSGLDMLGDSSAAPGDGSRSANRHPVPRKKCASSPIRRWRSRSEVGSPTNSPLNRATGLKRSRSSDVTWRKRCLPAGIRTIPAEDQAGINPRINPEHAADRETVATRSTKSVPMRNGKRGFTKLPVFDGGKSFPSRSQAV